MDDLISRQAAIGATTDENIVRNMDSVYDSELHRCKRAMHRILASLPSAERKKGKWIIKHNPGTGWYSVTCPECGEDVTSVIPMIGFFPNAKVLWNFCPDCGTEMENSNEIDR